jgi:uncharacterized protein (TIGR03437 family)
VPSPSMVTLGGVAGGTVQTNSLTLTNPYPVPVNFAVSSPASWLSVTPAGGTVPAQGSATLTVSADPGSLAARSDPYGVSLTIATSSAGSATATTKVLVQFVVAAAPSGSIGSSGPLNVLLVGLGVGPTVELGTEVLLQVLVTNRDGNAVAPSNGGSVQTNIASGNGNQALNMAYQGGGIWTAGWTPVSVGPATITILAVESLIAQIVSGSLQVSVSVIPSGFVEPSVGAIADDAAQTATNLVSPGEAITIYGPQLADCAAASSLPFPTQLCGAQVLIDGVPLPLYFVSPDQIDAQLPFGLTENISHELIVQRDGQLSAPFQVNVVPATPGVFTQNGAGTGAADVLNTAYQLVTSNNPLHPGDTTIIYCSGLGTVESTTGIQGQSGVPAPFSTLLLTVNSVSVTIGGQPAPVIFAGLAPGFVGLYQINVTVPSGVASGQAPLVVTVADQTSPTVTLAVQNP